jgi:hypothetical protein
VFPDTAGVSFARKAKLMLDFPEAAANPIAALRFHDAPKTGLNALTVTRH